MAHELIHPNWHVILIHYPMALLSLGLLIEVFSFLYRRSTLRLAGRWMLLIGALSCLPAAASGLYAYYDVVRYAGQGEVSMEPADDAWYQLVDRAEVNLGAQQWDDLKHHIWRMASGTIIVILATLTYLGASDRWRRRLYFPCLLLVLFAAAVLASGAWHAGESVHTRGTAIERDATKPRIDRKHIDATVQQFVPPLQLHVLLAGVTIAMAVAALGLSIRAINTRAVASRPARENHTHDQAYADLPASVQVEMTVVGPPAPARVYPARFWLLATLAGLATLAAGLWVYEFTYEEILPVLSQPRDRAHVILGLSILLLTLILAAVTRWGRGRKWTMGFFATLLFAAIAGQVWMGIVLMYDGWDKQAPLFRFRQPEAPATAAR